MQVCSCIASLQQCRCLGLAGGAYLLSNCSKTVNRLAGQAQLLSVGCQLLLENLLLEEQCTACWSGAGDLLAIEHHSKWFEGVVRDAKAADLGQEQQQVNFLELYCTSREQKQGAKARSSKLSPGTTGVVMVIL